MNSRVEIDVTLIDDSHELYRVDSEGTYSVTLRGVIIFGPNKIGIKRTLCIPMHQIKCIMVYEVDGEAIK